VGTEAIEIIRKEGLSFPVRAFLWRHYVVMQLMQKTFEQFSAFPR